MEERHVTGRLDLSVPAQAVSLARVRQLLLAFLREQRVGNGPTHSALVVTTELAANAIEHGSREQDDLERSRSSAGGGRS